METQARHRSKPPSQFRCRAPRPDGRRCTRSISRSGRPRRVTHWPYLPMELPGRRYLCAGCRAPVLICSCCDRGNRYCTAGCAPQARHQSIRAAGRRYQDTHRGRLTHAQRQRRYRARQQKVTHQGSPPPPLPVQLATEPIVKKSTSPPPWHCHLCNQLLPEFVRQDFLRRRIRRSHPDRRAPFGPYPRN